MSPICKSAAVQDLRHAAGQPIAEQQRPPEQLRAAHRPARQQPHGRRQDRVIRGARVTGVDGGGKKHPLGVIQPDQWKLQQAPEAFRRPQTRLVAPGEVGQRAGGNPQAPFRRGLVREQPRCPLRQRGREGGHAGIRQSEGLRRLDQRIEELFGRAELRIEPAFAHAQHGEDDPLRPQPLHHPVEDQRRRGQAGGPAPRQAGQRGNLCRRRLQQGFREGAGAGGLQGVAVHHAHRRVAGRQVHPGEGAPAAADGIEGRAADAPRNAIPQQRVHPRLRRGNAAFQQLAHRQRTERQADAVGSDAVIQDIRHFQAAAAHVSGQPGGAVETGYHPEGAEIGLLLAAQDACRETGLPGDLGDEIGPVARLPHRLGGERIDPFNAHGLGNGAEPAQGGQGPGDAVRRQRPSARVSLAQLAERLLVEARKRRPADGIVNDEADGVGADVDDRIGGASAAVEAPDGQIQRAFRCSGMVAGIHGRLSFRPSVLRCKRPLREADAVHAVTAHPGLVRAAPGHLCRIRAEVARTSRTMTLTGRRPVSGGQGLRSVNRPVLNLR